MGPNHAPGIGVQTTSEAIGIYKGRFEEALSDLIIELQQLPMKERAAISWKVQTMGTRFVHGLNMAGSGKELPLFSDKDFIISVSSVIEELKTLEQKNRWRVMDKVRFMVDLARALGIKFKDMGAHNADSFLKDLPEIVTHDYE